uniref:Uncharacterized protein n=1 Tax=Glossina palpalis gambiensis TaxID=67801 RepID=A0A1B0BG65_9MUSC
MENESSVTKHKKLKKLLAFTSVSNVLIQVWHTYAIHMHLGKHIALRTTYWDHVIFESSFPH